MSYNKDTKRAKEKKEREENKMSMMEYFEMGYAVVCESMFGSVVMEDADMVECYAEDSEFSHVDEDAHVAYFEDAQDYDD